MAIFLKNVGIFKNNGDGIRFAIKLMRLYSIPTIKEIAVKSDASKGIEITIVQHGLKARIVKSVSLGGITGGGLFAQNMACSKMTIKKIASLGRIRKSVIK